MLRIWLPFAGTPVPVTSLGIQGLMDSNSSKQLITTLITIPDRELIEIINAVLSQRKAEVVLPKHEEAQLILARAYRTRDAGQPSSEWELLVLASPQEPGTYVTNGSGPTQEGTCCGVTLAAYSKAIICPICGKHASAT